jgi:hypothetical protein
MRAKICVALISIVPIPKKSGCNLRMLEGMIAKVIKD